jgi:pRiA4b ORF-3-like protein/LexA DNA binding domain-containing protein
MADFTPTQGRYLAFIHAYTSLHGCPPAESEIATALCVSPPSVNQMIKTLERNGLIHRQPGQPRSIRILVAEDEVPPWRRDGSPPSSDPPMRRVVGRRLPVPVAGTPVNLYVVAVYLSNPSSKKFAKKGICRVIEIRGDQTLDQLHEAIFKAFDRWDEHLYQFQFGQRPFDPCGPKFGVPGPEWQRDRNEGDACTTKLDELVLKPNAVFGYWFDFGESWYHSVWVERVERAIPTVTYPRVIRRVGKSPPQYCDEL